MYIVICVKLEIKGRIKVCRNVGMKAGMKEGR